MTIQEQIDLLRANREKKIEELKALTTKSMDEGRTMDADEGDTFDALEADIEQIDKDLARLERAKGLMVVEKTASSATGSSGREASSARSGAQSAKNSGHIFVKGRDADDSFQGQSFTRRVIAKTLAQLDGVSASSIAEARWGKSNPTLVEIVKANEVAGGGTGAGQWGAELVSTDNRYTGDFIEFLDAMTVFFRLGLRDAPANVTVKGQDGQATGYWVGQGKAIPVSAADFSDVNLTPLKVAALAVISEDLMRESSPAAEALVRDSIVEATAQRIDTTFLSATAAVAGVSPAGILNGLSAVTPSGTDGAAVRADLKSLYASFLTAKNASGLTLVMNKGLAKSIQLMTNALGNKEFPGITQDGGTLEGDNVITGDNVGATDMILMKPSDIFKIADNNITVSISREAMIEMNSVPTGDSQTPAAGVTTAVSMFQTDSIALKVVRPINFQKRRASAVQYVTGADYGAIASV